MIAIIAVCIAVYIVGFVLAARYIPTCSDEPGHEHSYSAWSGCSPEMDAICNGVFWPFLFLFAGVFWFGKAVHRG